MNAKVSGNLSKNNENLPPVKSCSETEDNISNTETKYSNKQRSDHVKQQQGRRRKWWYFNRGLQPISEVVENKDDSGRTDESTITIIRELESNRKVLKADKKDRQSLDSQKQVPSDAEDGTTALNTNSFSQPSYSACFKLIEKFQEAVLDSAVRVIQAAFKRFRERRRFLRLKKAVTVIQRNVRKWLHTKHPCLRPAEFDRQRSDSARSDEYRESVCEDKGEDFIEEDVIEEEHLESEESTITEKAHTDLEREHNKQYLDDESTDTTSCSCLWQSKLNLCVSNGNSDHYQIASEEDDGVQQECDFSDECESSSSCDIDDGFASMDSVCMCECCCVVAELSGGLCHCNLPADFDCIGSDSLDRNINRLQRDSCEQSST